MSKKKDENKKTGPKFVLEVQSAKVGLAANFKPQPRKDPGVKNG